MGRAERCVLAVGLVVALLTLGGCERAPSQSYQGYVEGEFVYVAGKIGGRLDKVAVVRGETVQPGSLLFVLDQTYERQGVVLAEAQLREAADTLHDKEKGLRPEEIAQIEADLRRAQAARKLAMLEYGRRRRLYADATIAKEELDTSRTSHLQTAAEVRQLEAKLATGRLPSRLDQVRAARAAVEAAQASLEQARWNLDQKTQRAAVGGLVFDITHYAGEWVSAGSPVVTLLPPENVKVRFFVPQAVAGGLHPGQSLHVSWDGGRAPVAGTISYIAPKVEYTPPVIYSQGFRDKLVIMVEAAFAPAVAARMHPGQPVDVLLDQTQPGSAR